MSGFEQLCTVVHFKREDVRKRYVVLVGQITWLIHSSQHAQTHSVDGPKSHSLGLMVSYVQIHQEKHTKLLERGLKYGSRHM